MIYKMKAKTGKLGANTNQTQIKWSSLTLRVLLAVVMTGFALAWLAWSENRDNVRMNTYDRCLSAYQDNAL